MLLQHKIILLLVMIFTIKEVHSQVKIFEIPVTDIKEIGTNSVQSDFGPAVVMDSLYFTTFNENAAKKYKKYKFYDLFKAGIDRLGKVNSSREPLKEFVSEFNDGPVSWCEKTGELFITQNYLGIKKKQIPFTSEINRLRIMIAKKENGKWVKIEDFPYNNPSYSIGHPAINETGDTLIFSSDKPGGYGETDIYYSVKTNYHWSEPVNLGPQINTSGKEEFSFLTDQHLNGRFLIFASTGRGALGGLDLYYCRFPYDNTGINHFDSPINTPFDDFSMCIPKDAEYGFLTSNRPGTGSDDIYRFTFKRNSCIGSQFEKYLCFR